MFVTVDISDVKSKKRGSGENRVYRSLVRGGAHELGENVTAKNFALTGL